MWTNYLSFFMLYLGTFFNILVWYSSTHLSVRMIALVWQFIMYMQFLDTFGHMTTPFLRSYTTYGTFTFNMLQPIIVALLFAFISDSVTVRYLLATLSGIYLLVVLFQYKFIQFKESRELEDLFWWADMSYTVFPLYMLIFIVAFMTMKPLWMGICQLGYIFSALILSYISGHEDVLCWFIACAPIATYLLLVYKPIPN